jgi:hypothetical protein
MNGGTHATVRIHKSLLTPHSELHLSRKAQNAGWFVGLYATSLISISAMMGAVRWILALL